MKWMKIKYVFSVVSKKQIFDGCVTKLCKNQLQKTFPNYFSRIFSQHFSSRPYSNVKIILA